MNKLHSPHPLDDFPGHVPQRAGNGIEYEIVDIAEFITRRDREDAPTPEPGEVTEHGLRLRLLELEREQREEQAIRTTKT